MPWLLFLVVLLDWDESIKLWTVLVNGSIDTASASDTGAPVDNDDSDQDDAEDTQDTEDTQPTSDIDGDGFSVEDGDCDDSNPLIYPTMTDDCDGIDNNCDGNIDESAIGAMYEPNDIPWNGYFWGTIPLDNIPKVQGLITTESDVDIYEFFLKMDGSMILV